MSLFVQVQETSNLCESLLGDLSGHRNLKNESLELLDDLRSWRQDQFDDWSRHIQMEIEDTQKPLR